jgi:hypothetical protein
MGGKDACDGLMMRKDNVEAGVVLTTSTTTATAMTTTTGIAAEMPDGVRDKLKALLERDKVGLSPLRGRGVPLVGIGIGGQWGGGGLMRVLLDAPMTIARTRGLMPMSHSCRRLCPPWTSFMIRGQRLGRRRTTTMTTRVMIRERGMGTREQ